MINRGLSRLPLVCPGYRNKRDELTIAVKGLADTTRQLVRAYGEHVKTIQELKKRVDELEAKKG